MSFFLNQYSLGRICRFYSFAIGVFTHRCLKLRSLRFASSLKNPLSKERVNALIVVILLNYTVHALNNSLKLICFKIDTPIKLYFTTSVLVSIQLFNSTPFIRHGNQHATWISFTTSYEIKLLRKFKMIIWNKFLLWNKKIVINLI